MATSQGIPVDPESKKPKKAWKKSKLSHVPIVDDTAGNKYPWRFEWQWRNFYIKNRFAS